MQHNCGKCIPCRVNYASQWTVRLLYELTNYYELGASFVTLTYDNENLPKDNSLSKKELSNFFKRLRRNLEYEYHEFTPKIKYYACGEYGDKEKIYFSPGAIKPHGRCHYHAIIFGLNSYNDKHREILRKSWNKCEPWFFDKERGRQSGMQEVNADDIRYVTGYTQKKLFGEMAKETYGIAQPPFALQSLGLGKDFALENKDRLLNNNFTYLHSKKIGLPRYFYKCYGVKASDVIEFRQATQESIKKEMEYEIQEFHRSLKRICPWYFDEKGNIIPDVVIKQSAIYERRFLQWQNNRQFEITKSIENNYKNYAKLRGAKI